jgi:hypothetical protein
MDNECESPMGLIEDCRCAALCEKDTEENTVPICRQCNAKMHLSCLYSLLEAQYTDASCPLCRNPDRIQEILREIILNPRILKRSHRHRREYYVIRRNEMTPGWWFEIIGMFISCSGVAIFLFIILYSKYTKS